MIRLSIRRKIMGIAIALIVLMTITAILSMAWVIEVGARLQELTNGYIPAYGSLAHEYPFPRTVVGTSPERH